MRKKGNFKKFGHNTKSKEMQKGYTDAVYGSGRSTSKETESLELDETAPITRAAGAGEPIPTNQKPYESWQTRIRDKTPELLVNLVILIAVAFFGWIGLTLFSQSNQNERHEEVLNGLKEDVDALETKYGDLNDDSIRTETLLETIRQDLNRLQGKL